MSELREAIFSTLHACGASAFLKRLRVLGREVTILTFHRVSDDVDPLWPPMPVEIFKNLIEFVSCETVVIDLETLPSLTEYPDKPLVCLSFDDGYADFHENALPILSRHGLPCHHNICPGLIDTCKLPWTQVVSDYLKEHRASRLVLPNDQVFNIPEQVREPDFLRLLEQLYTLPHQIRTPFIEELHSKTKISHHTKLMTWNQIRECHSLGVRIGSHSNWHNHLQTIEDYDLLFDEIAGSRRRITEELGEAPSIFAFPNGFYDERCLKIVRAAGYRFALLCEDQPLKFPVNRPHDFYSLTRLNMTNSSFKEEWLRGMGFHGWIKKLLKFTSQ